MFYDSPIPTQRSAAHQQTNAAVSLHLDQYINNGVLFAAKANRFIWLGADSSYG